jgi:hypothetical protein
VSDRVCIIHIGTHKTGTTALQIFLEQNRPALERAGLYLPRAGRPGTLPGNHQIGWDLLVHGASADVPKLREELQTSVVRSALLTSEDLSLLYARPETLELLQAAISDAGYRAKIVVYVRTQAAYAESMYVERIKHDYIRPLGAYLERILDTGMYVPDGSPIQIDFRYPRLLEPFVKVFGKEHVVVRPYSSASGPEYIYRDFLQVIGTLDPPFRGAPLDLTVQQLRANESLSFIQLLQTAYLKLHPQGIPGADPLTIIAKHAPGVPAELLTARYALLSREEHLRFLAAFAPENVALQHEFGVALPFTDESDVADATESMWQRAQIQRALFDQLLELWMGLRPAG